MAKRLETVSMMTCTKTLLMMFNCCLWLFGLLLLRIGILLRTQLRDHIDISTEGNRSALLALASLGAILTLTATVACCCTTRGHPALLYLYGAFLAVFAFLILGTGASIYAYRGNLNEKYDQDLNRTMEVYGQDDKKTDYMDTTQSTLQCCGNRGYTDWANIYPPKDVPLSCCKVPKDTCDVDNVNDIYTQGCYTRVLDLINNNIGLVAAMAVVIALSPFIGVFLACFLASNINKAKYEQVA